ncbi:MAG TPA: DUF1559 domain-containing protein, partial [Gemmataceae bacterium]|nr:DUF1559 domain-containing protein [Gemmataceae bacterium]
AEEYHAFVKDYNQYWRTYFDPIALRLQITPNRYRLETVVLPLIDNSIYTSLARVLGGKPQNLDALPVPKRNIFTFAIRVNKEELRHEVGLAEAPAEDGQKPAAGRHVVTAADRHCAQDLQQIGLALHNYHDAYEQFPAAASHDRGGNPLLSWRVHLLPFLEQQALYDEFHLDEPWDSEHNKKLIARMPAVYRCGGPQLAARGKTTCVAPVGKRTIFPPDGRKVTFASITDGSSETIAVVTVDRDHAVTWTRPDDLEFDPEKPSAGLFNKRRPIAPVVFVDASVHFLRDTIDEKTLQALFTRDAGDHFVVKDTDGIDDTAGVDLLHIPGVDPAEIERLKVEEFLARGVGDQVTLNIYDAPPMFDFNVPGFLGLMAGSFNGSTRAVGTEELLVSFVVASLNAPVYIGIPVQDGKVVDRFLDRLDHPLAVAARQHEGGFLPVDFDFYKFPSKQDKNKVFRSYGLRLGPAKLRLFWARIGGGLYIASKPFILEDLLAAEADRATAPAHDKSKDTGPRAHAMVRIRPQHWDKVLPDFRLGWAENNREACLNNIGPLSSVARAYTGTAGKINEVDVGQVSARILQYADFLHTVHFFCPDGGSYVLAPDRKSMVCSVHGSILAPRQADAPADKSALGRLLDTFTGMTASLTFLADGLHAVVTIDRK